MITANYTLGGNCYMVATSNLRSFKAGHVAAIPNEDNELMTESGIQISKNSTRTANDGGTVSEGKSMCKRLEV